MANISNYLRRLWQKALELGKNHPVSLFVLFLLSSIPLSLALGNIALMLFAAASLYFFSKHKFFRVEWQLLLPVALFISMALSIARSINPSRSANALPKEIVLFAVPVCFMMFPVFSRTQKSALLQNYAYVMTALGVLYVLKSLFRFFQSGDKNVFFYHELVTKEVNAIHVSIYMAVAFFALLPKVGKQRYDWCCLGFLGVLMVLLSSKNVIAIFLLLLTAYAFFFSGFSTKKKVIALTLLIAMIALPILVFDKITDRFQIEYQTAFTAGTVNEELSNGEDKVYNVSVPQAWQQEMFKQNDFFPGTAFRVYQARIFFEMLSEDNVFFTGYGLNASNIKIREKSIEHNLWAGDANDAGYKAKNFHNQYIQNFADLGIFGLILLVAMLVVTLKNGLKMKDFTHISFAVLMISLFLTESFLWRQRGAVFFVAMYCLFNSGVVAVAAPKKE
ncbi:MAG: hypothetical protein EOO50_03510 [Flavobacterium sp.]|uniref:O-antigen ligase family protein n=1 Tax=Flavobacterium sp. TaxID=239 RepID=UPI001212EBE5|nr:O-antigen ligase family protein [Flavobacterium sp.]RZJ67901.1 MAG: hypothetical protein EOO50_03510 [Flavobacterium sp.]